MTDQNSPEEQPTEVMSAAGNQVPLNQPVYVVQQSPGPQIGKSARAFGERVMGGIKSTFTGQQGSVFWLIGQAINGVKMVIEAVNERIKDAQESQARSREEWIRKQMGTDQSGPGGGARLSPGKTACTGDAHFKEGT